MPNSPYDTEHLQRICLAASKRLKPGTSTRRWPKRDFDKMNAALIIIETNGLETFGGSELPQLIARMRSGEANAQVKNLPFSIKSYLYRLQAQLRRRREQVFQVGMLNNYLRMTEQIWQVCQEQDLRPDRVVPPDRYRLAVVIKEALEQPNTRASS